MLSTEQIKHHTEKIFARSSGPGGQNVNKSSTKVILTFDILNSPLEGYEKYRLIRKYPSGFIQVGSQETRSQLQNLSLAFEHLRSRIEQGLFVQPPRRKTVAPHLKRSGKKAIVRKERLLKYRKRYLE